MNDFVYVLYSVRLCYAGATFVREPYEKKFGEGWVYAGTCE